MRMIQIQDNISEQKNLKDKLESEQEKLHVEYNKVKIQCSSQVRFYSPHLDRVRLPVSDATESPLLCF